MLCQNERSSGFILLLTKRLVRKVEHPEPVVAGKPVLPAAADIAKRGANARQIVVVREIAFWQPLFPEKLPDRRSGAAGEPVGKRQRILKRVRRNLRLVVVRLSRIGDNCAKHHYNTCQTCLHLDISFGVCLMVLYQIMPTCVAL